MKQGTTAMGYAYNASGIRTAKHTESTDTYFQLDGGDVVALTDSTGAVTKRYDYDAFGNEENPDSTDANSFRYCGEYFDKETGTYYLRARYYDPAIGRFTQQDTHWSPANAIYGDNPRKINERQDALGLTTYAYAPEITAIMQSGNLYVYCVNSPVMYFDTTGYFIGTIIGAITGALGGALTAFFQGNNIGYAMFAGLIGGIIGGVGLDIGILLGLGTGGIGAAGGFAIAAGASAVGSAVQNIVERLLNDDEVELSSVGISALIGLVFGALSFGLGTMVTKAFSATFSAFPFWSGLAKLLGGAGFCDSILSVHFSLTYIETMKSMLETIFNGGSK